MAKLVSKVYGDALFEVAVESGRLDEIWEQTRAMQTALEENPDTRKKHFISSDCLISKGDTRLWQKDL